MKMDNGVFVFSVYQNKTYCRNINLCHNGSVKLEYISQFWMTTVVLNAPKPVNGFVNCLILSKNHRHFFHDSLRHDSEQQQ